MESCRLIFDSSSSHPGHVLILGGSGSHPIFRGTRSVLGMEEGANKRQPFFTSPEELLEEEYYDVLLPEKKRRLTPEQVHLLEKSFEADNKLEPERKSELAKKLGLQLRQVAVWFQKDQNRRARWKTKQLERDFDRLKEAYDSLLTDHESHLKDNDRLRSQAKELAVAVGPMRESPGEEAALSLQMNIGGSGKMEDHLSTGSAVVDEEGSHQQLAVDSSSGDSCYLGHESFRGDCVVGHVGTVYSEDDGSDDGCYCLPEAMFGESHHAATVASAADNWPWGVWN